MPPAMAKALNLKQPGAPRRNPVPARERNPLQYLLKRGSDGRGVILSGLQATQLAKAFMDTQNWARQIAVQLAEAENEALAIEQAWIDSGVESFYDTEDYVLNSDEAEAFDILRELVNPSEADEEDEDA